MLMIVGVMVYLALPSFLGKRQGVTSFIARERPPFCEEDAVSFLSRRAGCQMLHGEHAGG
jgi:hypothetical protein